MPTDTRHPQNNTPQQPLHVLTTGAHPEVRPSFAPLPTTIGGIGGIPSGVHALYVHVPFCTTKCHYCDFYSLAGHLAQADPFLDALAQEIALYRQHLGTIQPQTIFIGGGTPTLLDPPRLNRLLSLITSNINPSRLTEFTVEANPNTFDPDRAATLASHGVNRISFGAQSFILSELKTLQRDHDPENVPKAFAIARSAGITNLNLDLIFGIPNQTLDTWEYSLSQALALNPQHMSCYSLTYEPNTPMTARMHRGDFTPIDEELELQMFNHVYSRMKDANFTRYEVSNYAQAGRECQHNIHYWKGSNWLAWGPSAAAHINGHRWKNVNSLAHYLTALLPPAPNSASPIPHSAFRISHSPPTFPLTQMEHLSPLHWAGEVATFWLRLSEGLNYAEFLERTHIDARPRLEKALQKYADLHFLELLPNRARLLEKAIPVSNPILRDALAAFT